jgi:hypothetical protein
MSEPDPGPPATGVVVAARPVVALDRPSVSAPVLTRAVDEYVAEPVEPSTPHQAPDLGRLLDVMGLPAADGMDAAAAMAALAGFSSQVAAPPPRPESRPVPDPDVQSESEPESAAPALPAPSERIGPRPNLGQSRRRGIGRPPTPPEPTPPEPGVPESAPPESRVPELALPAGVPGSALPGSAVPGSAVPEAGMPELGMPAPAPPELALPEPAPAESRPPASVLPEQALPGSALPGSAPAEPRLPGSAPADPWLPESALPESAVPGSALPESALPGAAPAEPWLPGSGVPGSGVPGSAVPESALPASAPAEPRRPKSPRPELAWPAIAPPAATTFRPAPPATASLVPAPFESVLAEPAPAPPERFSAEPTAPNLTAPALAVPTSIAQTSAEPEPASSEPPPPLEREPVVAPESVLPGLPVPEPGPGRPPRGFGLGAPVSRDLPIAPRAARRQQPPQLPPQQTPQLPSQPTLSQGDIPVTLPVGPTYRADLATLPPPVATETSTTTTTLTATIPSDLSIALSPVLGVDVSNVPVRRGPEVTSTAKVLHARAYTTGGEIHLPAEAGELDTPATRALLAHELVHAAQQRVLGPALPLETSPEGQALEASALATERWFRGEAARPTTLVHRPPAPESPMAMAAVEQTRQLAQQVEQLAAATQQAHGTQQTQRASDTTTLPAPVQPPAPAPASDLGAGTVTRSWSLTDVIPEPPRDAPDVSALQDALAGLRRSVTELSERPDPPAPPDLDDQGTLDDLATKLFGRIRSRLRRELLVDRERTGRLTDFG